MCFIRGAEIFDIRDSVFVRQGSNVRIGRHSVLSDRRKTPVNIELADIARDGLLRYSSFRCLRRFSYHDMCFNPGAEIFDIRDPVFVRQGSNVRIGRY